MLNKSRDILEKHPSGLNVAKDALDIGPEPPLVLDALLLPGDAERLAGESRRDEIHDSTPRAAVEGGEVIPDRSLTHGLVRHPRHEDSRCVGFPLDVTDSAISGDGEVESKLEAADAGTESQAIHPSTRYTGVLRAWLRFAFIASHLPVGTRIPRLTATATKAPQAPE